MVFFSFFLQPNLKHVQTLKNKSEVAHHQPTQFSMFQVAHICFRIRRDHHLQQIIAAHVELGHRHAVQEHLWLIGWYVIFSTGTGDGSNPLSPWSENKPCSSGNEGLTSQWLKLEVARSLLYFDEVWDPSKTSQGRF